MCGKCAAVGAKIILMLCFREGVEAVTHRLASATLAADHRALVAARCEEVMEAGVGNGKQMRLLRRFDDAVVQGCCFWTVDAKILEWVYGNQNVADITAVGTWRCERG